MMRSGSKPSVLHFASEGTEVLYCGLPLFPGKYISPNRPPPPPTHLDLWVDKTWINIEKDALVEEFEKIVS